VRSLTNIAVPESSKFIMARNTNQPVFISLPPHSLSQ
jgi:hypothetical protein